LAPSTQAPEARAKTKGVADIVFVIDISGSMAPCIDALRQNIETFVGSLSSGDANNAAPVKDWRAKVVGYRDIEAAESEGLPWIVDNCFRRDQASSKAQLAACRPMAAATSRSRFSTRSTRSRRWRRRQGRADREAGKWRYRSDAARVVVVFTDASFKER
jgi:hypothetical protein